MEKAEKSRFGRKSRKVPKSRFRGVRISALFASFELKFACQPKVEGLCLQHKFGRSEGLQGRGRASPKSRFRALRVVAHEFGALQICSEKALWTPNCSENALWTPNQVFLTLSFEKSRKLGSNGEF